MFSESSGYSSHSDRRWQKKPPHNPLESPPKVAETGVDHLRPKSSKISLEVKQISQVKRDILDVCYNSCSSNQTPQIRLQSGYFKKSETTRMVTKSPSLTGNVCWRGLRSVPYSYYFLNYKIIYPVLLPSHRCGLTGTGTKLCHLHTLSSAV